MTRINLDVPATTFCPDETLLASFIDERLPADQLRSIRDHLAACEVCRATVAGTLRSLAALGEVPLAPLPDEVLRRAEELVAPAASPAARPSMAANSSRATPAADPPVAGARPAPRKISRQWFAVAAAGLLVGFALARLWPSPVAPPTPVQPAPHESNESPDMRGAIDRTFTTLLPKDQALVELDTPADLLLKWSTCGGSAATPDSVGPEGGVSYYVATVLNDAGRVVWEGRTQETEIRPSANAPIIPGATYRWSVVAYFTFGTSSVTRPATFAVSRRRGTRTTGAPPSGGPAG